MKSSILVLASLVTQFSSCSKIYNCGFNSFYDFELKQCKACSSCPSNQIIKIPCSETADLECVYYNFSNPDAIVLNPFEDQGNLDDYIDHQEENDEEPMTVEKEDREYWKTLAFALIGLLTVLIIVASVVVLVACRKLQKAGVVKQPDEGETDDADSGYVVIHAIRNITDSRPHYTNYDLYSQDDQPPLLSISNPGSERNSSLDPFLGEVQVPGKVGYLPKVYKPQRRLLTYDADDVFESEDSGGTYLPALSTKLHTTTTETIASSKSQLSDT